MPCAVKEELRWPADVRFSGDFLVFGKEKRDLAERLDSIRGFLAPYRLRLHPRKCVILPVRVGVPFLGWRVFPDHRRLRRTTGVRFQRGLQELAAAYADGEATLAEVKASIMSWIGHLKHGDTWGLRGRLLDATVFVRQPFQADSNQAGKPDVPKGAIHDTKR